MINLLNDYSEFAHEKILEKMFIAAREANVGYGLDKHTANAKELIRKVIDRDVDIHILVGGTQTNKTVIDYVLRPYQAVISCDTGHINVHETGAIEATGHKVISVPGENGKLTAELIKEVVYKHTDEHMVMPKMVYISDATETGSIYSKAELEQISLVCKKLGLYLYLDGARLGVALTSKDNDLTINDISELTDIFYIGGTKNGALLGEALVIGNEKLKNDFRYIIKQNGGLLAKGFIAGVQFEELFTDNLFFELGHNANNMAKLLKEELSSIGYQTVGESPTNQQFISVSDEVLEYLKKGVLFEVWGKNGTETIIRLVTSWATTEEQIQEFITYLKKAPKR